MKQARIALTGQFESAHFLPHVPAEHRCRRLHGHTYSCEVELHGPLDATLGWVEDFGAIEAIVAATIAVIDHRLLNDIDGLQNPTSERLAHWFWARLAPQLPALSRVAIWENPRMRAEVCRQDVG